MRTDYKTGQAQGSRIHNCGWCGRRYYESLLRECPEREGRRVCMYCCRSCPHCVREGAGEGCDAMPKKGHADNKKQKGTKTNGKHSHDGTEGKNHNDSEGKQAE